MPDPSTFSSPIEAEPSEVNYTILLSSLAAGCSILIAIVYALMSRFKLLSVQKQPPLHLPALVTLSLHQLQIRLRSGES